MGSASEAHFSPECSSGSPSPAQGDATHPQDPLCGQVLVSVRYLDHVLYHRTPALAMKPQERETVGWLIYECDQYITLAWDHDAEPPTLRGGDPKASGLVILKTDITKLERLEIRAEPSQKSSNWHLNSEPAIVSGEYALLPKKRKTQRKGKEQR